MSEVDRNSKQTIISFEEKGCKIDFTVMGGCVMKTSSYVEASRVMKAFADKFLLLAKVGGHG